MADTAEATATEEITAETAEQAFEYPITVEDAGPSAKKISVQIPRNRIDDEVKKQFGELRRKAAIPPKWGGCDARSSTAGRSCLLVWRL